MHLTYISSQKILDTKKVNLPPLEGRLYSTCAIGQKIFNIKKVKQSSLLRKKSQKVDDTKIILLITTKFYAKNMAKKTVLAI